MRKSARSCARLCAGSCARSCPSPSKLLALASLLLLLAQPGSGGAQTNTADALRDEPYRLNLAVDEVTLTFHAADPHGLPVNDLRRDELRLFDNGKPPRRIVDFHLLQDFPIRAGILVDTSESMEHDLPGNRAISIEYAQRILRQKTDQAFVMDFAYISTLKQDWTSDPAALTNGIRQIVAGRDNPLGGTALYDTIFRACLYPFAKIDHAASANFILLFSDGEDNASHVSLQEAVDRCQRSNTAIYAFHAQPAAASHSSGPETLRDLTSQTGGRVFTTASSDPEANSAPQASSAPKANSKTQASAAPQANFEPEASSETEIDADLHLIEADLRNQYRLVYNPTQIKPDGSFHRIALLGPNRVDSITVRSGYYAPKQ
jgi:Ca-activated chloride channel homolog